MIRVLSPKIYNSVVHNRPLFRTWDRTRIPCAPITPTSASAVVGGLPEDRKLQGTRWRLARRSTSAGRPRPFPSTVRCGPRIGPRSWWPARPSRIATTYCGTPPQNDDASFGSRNGNGCDRKTEWDYAKYNIVCTIHSTGNTTATTMATIKITRNYWIDDGWETFR